MSRDVFYIVPSDSDGRNDQQAATNEPNSHRHRDESNSSTTDTDHNDNIESSGEERVRPFIKERVYYAAKDGLPIALTSLLSNVESEVTKNAYINQVSWNQFRLHFCYPLRTSEYNHIFIASTVRGPYAPCMGIVTQFAVPQIDFEPGMTANWQRFDFL